MHLQVVFCLLMLSLLLMTGESIQPYQPKSCAECVEEVWEEVPCDVGYSPSTEMPITTSSTTFLTPPITPTPSSSPTPASTPVPTTTSTPTPTTSPTPTPSASSSSMSTESPITIIPTPSYSPIYKRPYPITPTVSPPIYSSPYPLSTPPPESTDAFKNCYCQCKSSCKEFCRQVVYHPNEKKQVTELSKTIQPVPYGNIEFKHLHERNWVPTAPPTYNSQPSALYQQNQNQIPKTLYAENEPTYDSAPQLLPQIYPPSYETPNYPLESEIDSLGYSIEELTRLLDHSYSNTIPVYSQPSYNYPSPQLPPNQPEKLPSYNQPAPRLIESIHVDTSSTDVDIANAIGSTPNNYKSLKSNNDQSAAPYVAPQSPAVSSPYPPNYVSRPTRQNNIPNFESVVENYLRNILYPHPSRTREYGYPLTI